jgi:hypothetical protein
MADIQELQAGLDSQRNLADNALVEKLRDGFESDEYGSPAIAAGRTAGYMLEMSDLLLKASRQASEAGNEKLTNYYTFAANAQRQAADIYWGQLEHLAPGFLTNGNIPSLEQIFAAYKEDPSKYPEFENSEHGFNDNSGPILGRVLGSIARGAVTVIEPQEAPGEHAQWAFEHTARGLVAFPEKAQEFRDRAEAVRQQHAQDLPGGGIVRGFTPLKPGENRGGSEQRGK